MGGVGFVMVMICGVLPNSLAVDSFADASGGLAGCAC